MLPLRQRARRFGLPVRCRFLVGHRRYMAIKYRIPKAALRDDRRQLLPPRGLAALACRRRTGIPGPPRSRDDRGDFRRLCCHGSRSRKVPMKSQPCGTCVPKIAARRAPRDTRVQRDVEFASYNSGLPFFPGVLVKQITFLPRSRSYSAGSGGSPPCLNLPSKCRAG
jgi:hypothetical protein